MFNTQQNTPTLVGGRFVPNEVPEFTDGAMVSAMRGPGVRGFLQGSTVVSVI